MDNESVISISNGSHDSSCYECSSNHDSSRMGVKTISESHNNSLLDQQSTTTNRSECLSHSTSATDSIFQRLRRFDCNEQSIQRLDDFSNGVSMQKHNKDLPTISSSSSNILSNYNEDVHMRRVNDNDVETISVNDLNHSSMDVIQDFDTDPAFQQNEEYVDDTSEEEDDFSDLILDESEIDDNRHKKLDKLIGDEECNEILDVEARVSKIEMILAIMRYCKKYHIPTMGMVDLFKMQNMFFNKNIFPDNRYQIDQLFNPDGNNEYHAVCPECKSYLNTFVRSQRIIFCEVCDENVDLKNPSYCDYFVMINVTKEIQHLVETNQDFYIDVVSRRNKESIGLFEDIYDGQKYKEFLASLPDDHKESYLTATFNSDGSPTFKSSKCSIWPIQLVLNEIPQNIRSQKTITCGLWFGRDKPNMTYFLRPFVDRMNQLSKNGIKCQLNNVTKNLHLYALCCCVDSVARAPMQGTVQYNGYYGCNWCLHPGVRVLHDTGYCIKYPILNEHPIRRTANDTLELMQRSVESNTPVFGIKNVTPLLLLNKFDIIDGFVPCSMHCVDSGVAKQFANYWFGSSKESYAIPKTYIKIIDRHMKKVKVPTQLTRLSRSVSDRAYWKAIEWCNWILFYSIPLLIFVCQENPNFDVYVKHWSLLVEAYHILLQSKITVAELQRADFLLKKFVANTELLYTDDAMTYNIHQLLHLSQSVADWGPLHVHSGYVFESGNGKIKRTIYAAKGVLNQVCRYLSLEESIIKLEKHVGMKKDSLVMPYIRYLENNFVEKSVKFAYRYFMRTVSMKNILIKFQLPIEKVRAYRKIIKDGCTFKSCEKSLYRSDNSFAILENGDYIEIQQFLINMENGKEYTAFKKVEVISERLLIDELYCVKQAIRITSDIEIIETKYINKACVWLKVDSTNYIASVPNMYWK